MARPKLWRKASKHVDIPVTPHRPQLELGLIYLLSCDFEYVYTLEGMLLLELDSVMNFFGLFTPHELDAIPVQYLRPIEYHISKVLPPTRRFYITKVGVPRLANRAVRNRKYKKDVRKLYETYDLRERQSAG